jgi:fucose 4-O-acetylase-like acetyltransferase
VRSSQRAEAHLDRLAVRGILIVLIVLGHNSQFRELAYDLYRVLYSFHVGGFFLLAMLVDPHRVTRAWIMSVVQRYLVPFGLAVVVYGLAYQAIELRFESVDAWLGSMVPAVIVATGYYLDTATGFEMLWFLPCFAVFVVARTFYLDAPRLVQAASFATALLAHSVVGLLPRDVSQNVPWSVVFAVYMAFPAITFRWLWTNHVLATSRNLFIASSISAFACGAVAQVMLGVVISPGDLELPSVLNPLSLIVTDVVLIFATLSICLLASSAKVLRPLGRVSLEIYLVHGLVGVAIMRGASLAGICVSAWMLVTSFLLTLATSFGIAHLFAVAGRRAGLAKV